MNSRLGISLQLLFALGQMPIFSDNNLVRCNGRDFAAIGRQENGMRISRYFFLQPGSHERSLRNNERHALALHVRAHQRPVGVVVLEEGNETRSHRHQLLGRYVHVMHLRRIDFEEVATVAHRDLFPGEMPSSVNGSIRLRD